MNGIDDTFNTFKVLKRTPFDEMPALYKEWWDSPNRMDDFFESHGWTWREYMDEWDKRYFQ